MYSQSKDLSYSTYMNFGEGGSTPPDFERTCCLIAHIGSFLIA